jgi:glycosyltransferase involved in cell wall biosynthesis
LKNVFLFSLKYAPGLYKEFSLLNSLFSKSGCDVSNMISQGYDRHLTRDDKSIFASHGIGTKGMIFDLLLFPKVLYRTFKNIKNKKGENIFLFYNPHPVNFIVQAMLKLLPNATVVTVLHEPYKTVEDRLAYGLKGFLFFSIVNVFQYLSLILSDKIITMSPYGRDLFLNHFGKYENRLISANLLMSKNTKVINLSSQRKYFSYVGRVNKGKGIDDFIKSVNYCIEQKISGIYFLIITSSNIDEYLSMLNSGWEDNLTVINKPVITDDEIDEVISTSKGVLILHQTASQSGVLPLCCKYGTPVIARNIKAFSQFFDNNGVMLDEFFKPSQLVESCKLVEQSFDIFSQNSLQVFKNNFSEDNFEKFYRELLK